MRLRARVQPAYSKLCSRKYETLVRRCFEKTGMRMDITGEDDALITPEGTREYTFTRLPVIALPPLPTVAALNVAAAAGDDAAAAAAGAEEFDSFVGVSPVEARDDEDGIDDEGALVDSADIDEKDDVMPAKELSTFAHMLLNAPAGYAVRVLAEHPPLSTNDMVGEIVGLRMANVGWCVGKVTSKLSKGKAPLNFKVQFEDDDACEVEMRDSMFLSSAAEYARDRPEMRLDASILPGAWTWVLLRVTRVYQR